MNEEIGYRQLDNGLTVITLESHSAPVTSFWIWYRVGARNEVPGVTGISHWVEHMLFKGTPRFGKGEITDAVTRNGGVLNGMTSLDWTTYYETLPSDRIELALQIESDRMVNATFDPAEVGSERTVIISEREGNENNPLFYLHEELASAAFRIHPYGQGVIGFKCDLRAMTREDLYNHYRYYYGPNNAVAVAVGDFQADQMVRLIEQYFGAIPRVADPPPVRAVEPPPEGERRVVVHRPAATAYYASGFHTPAASSADFFPLVVLDAILSGAQTPSSGTTRSAAGRTSRLYRALVDSGLASYAGAAYRATVDPYLFTITATARPGVKLEEIEAVVNREIVRLCEETPTPEELARAKKQATAGFVFSAEGVTNKARYLGYFDVVATYRLFTQFVDGIQSVSAEDVRRVAGAYLTERNGTVGWLIPESRAGAASAPPQSAAAWMAPPTAFWAEAERTDGSRSLPEIHRQTLANGIAVLASSDDADPSVVLRLALPAGARHDPPDQAGLANFTALALPRGTEARSSLGISELLDSLGASITVDAGTSLIEFNARCLSEDVDQVVGLLGEIARRPAFPEGEVEKVRGELLTTIRERENDTRSVADRRFHALAYSDDHPYRRPTIGFEPSVQAIGRDDLIGFYRKRYQPAGAVVAVAGKIDLDRLVATLERVLGDWPATGSATLEIPAAAEPVGLRHDEVTLPGKTQSDIVMGRPGIPRRHEDYYALSVANFILGRSSIKGRLGRSVREEQGLAYYVSSHLQSGFGPSPWTARAGVNPVNVERAIASIRREIARLLAEGVTARELEDTQGFLTGAMPLSLETNDGVARMLFDIELHDLGLDYLERYPGIILALTRDQLVEAARRHLSADDLVIAVAGPERAEAAEPK